LSLKKIANFSESSSGSVISVPLNSKEILFLVIFPSDELTACQKTFGLADLALS
jgi:hypothetical protein